MTVRRWFLAAYGVLVGLAFAAVIRNAAGVTSPVAIAAWIAALGGVFGLLGWALAGSPDWPSTWRIVVALPLAPFALAGGLLGLGVVLVPVAAMWPFLRVRHAVRERKYLNALRSQGRFVTADDLRPRLDAGLGTLIVDTGQKGPHRVWWTEDDLLGLGNPVSTKEEFFAALKGEHAFNARCLTEYLEDKTGKALLTSMRTGDFRGERLGRTFPKAKVVTVVRAFPRPEARDRQEP
jgi:hypothetical protein